MPQVSSITLGEVIGLFGLLFGLTGFILGVMNYLRDRAMLAVTLQWDMDVTPGTQYDHNKKWGVISVANAGRRTAYVSHAALRLPKGHDASHLVVMDSIQGEKLAEGDPTKVYLVDQDGLEPYASDWRKIVAQVSDSTGRIWKSKRLRGSPVPSWAAKRPPSAV